jgi:hypothetical protein
VKLHDLFRRISERFLRRSHAAGSNGVAPRPQDQAPAPPADEVLWAGEEAWRGNPLYVRSQEAFYRNLGELMKTHEEEWVAYHGDEYVIAAKTKDEAWEHCLQRGLKLGEFAVLFVHNYSREDHDTELGYSADM